MEPTLFILFLSGIFLNIPIIIYKIYKMIHNYFYYKNYKRLIKNVKHIYFVILLFLLLIHQEFIYPYNMFLHIVFHFKKKIKNLIHSDKLYSKCKFFDFF